MSAESNEAGASVGTRGPEAGVAALLLAIALLVIGDSLRVGAGWADDGPQSGYFPFYIGLLLLASSGWILGRQIWRWKQADTEFAQRSQIAQVVAILIPMVVYVALVYPLGIYIPSALMIGYFMRRYGHYRWTLTVPVAVGVPLFFFFIFERWFLVPLPKGPFERMLGL